MDSMVRKLLLSGMENRTVRHNKYTSLEFLAIGDAQVRIVHTTYRSLVLSSLRVPLHLGMSGKRLVLCRLHQVTPSWADA